MKIKKIKRNIFYNFKKLLIVNSFFFPAFLNSFISINAQDNRFIVVLDAGHGGEDPGAKGKISNEKDINLAVVKELGKMMEENKELKVIYTRKTDKYLTLQQRADIANQNHADLFLCIHTNASKNRSAFGAETYTLGLAKTQSNLEVAMRENSVILLEKDYKTKYEGFDPTSVDSYIMFEFMQDKYLDKSIELASLIQTHFNYHGRLDRGVRQAGFWVLHRSACPSVLVELGFISNPEEELFLNSKEGQRKMAEAIYKAFLEYKREHDKRNGISNNFVNTRVETKTDVKQNIPTDISPNQNIAKIEITDSNIVSASPVPLSDNLLDDQAIVFKIQIFTSRKKLPPNAPDFKGIKEVAFYEEDGLYKYTVGAESDYNKILNLRNEIKTKFPEAFIIAFKGNSKISVKDALKTSK
ncbi:MAG TPA: N-acetylmuramoyl-L-alanine amidase [Paludibacteraceae bacterium]|nr:N-acetylmuramoyl-L-alanine amidase [Paludibacteraceae bacterium]HOL01147.1 N-acetylmuramoyl-L-alanine amidase [Paludibacteraceae bacterium]HPC26215.1 N-acetylmuramoyl-L-alanine amidase [Paludibacteraceae bacterium]HPO67967.1 N-acetylmuramoyl-L-alanine amidase [Paludibacteraceae bacterium]HRU63223.1 N-acetylmuramoyl-L-alanine amidase [Paludibacteraceae bacterium]